MNVSQAAPEPLDCRLPERQFLPLVVASPHSGSTYPADFLAQTVVSLAALRRAEDAFVDELFGGAPTLGIPLLAARFPRSYVDANREPYELDPGMFEGPLPAGLNHCTTRVAAGLGMIPRVAATGEAIYRGPISSREIDRRLEDCWRPYHRTLAGLVGQTCATFGQVLLIDAHSMPSLASGAGLREPSVDVVLGDNHGESCSPGLIDGIERWLTAKGLRVRRNQPYAGGFTTQHYGHPAAGQHSLQIEINRALYMDEVRHTKRPTFRTLQRLVSDLLEEIGTLATGQFVRPLAAE
jgi:N-formylglutamate deformylase